MAGQLVSNKSKTPEQANSIMTRFIASLKPNSDQSEISVLILGSELTPRMKGHGPKSLMQVGKKFNVIETQIDSIKTVYPNADITLITGYQSQQIVNKGYGVSIIENPFYADTGGVEDIRIGLNVIRSDRVLVVNGDLVFDFDGLMSIKGKSSCVLVDETDYTPDSVGVTENNNVVESLGFGLRTNWGYALIAEGRELELLRKFVRAKERSKLMFHEAVNGIIAAKGLIRTASNLGLAFRMETRIK